MPFFYYLFYPIIKYERGDKMIKEIKTDNTLEITYLNGSEIVAFLSCIYHKAINELEITALFATEEYGNSYYEDMLIDEAFLFAAEHDARVIKTYIGPEPYNPAPYRTKEVELEWYKGYGFSEMSTVCGITPCVMFDTAPFL